MRGLEDFDLGPEEQFLILDEAELNSEQQRKIKELQSEKLNLLSELDLLRGKVCIKIPLLRYGTETDPTI